MNNRKPEDVVFETIASGALVITALAITALVQLITRAIPLTDDVPASPTPGTRRWRSSWPGRIVRRTAPC